VVDPMYLAEAEACIARHFDAYGTKLEYKNYDELVVLNKKQLAGAMEMYKMLQRTYAGDQTAEFLARQKKMEDAAHRDVMDAFKREREIDAKQHTLEKAVMQNEREMERAKFEHELVKQAHELVRQAHKYDMIQQESALSVANTRIEMLEREKELLVRELVLVNRENEMLRGIRA
jgi:hypothetical protein